MSDPDLERSRAFLARTMAGVAERRVPVSGGVALLVDSLPRVYDVNYVHALAAPPPSAEELASAADETMAHLHHRKVVVEQGGGELSAAFAALGFLDTEHLVLVRRREPDRRVDTSMVREVTWDELDRARRETTLRSPQGDDDLDEMLSTAKRRAAEAVGMRHFAAYLDGDVAAFCELRGDGGVAQIEDVNTLEEFRGRGFGRTIVQATLDEAMKTHDLVFLEALADDWPRELYAKLGFDIVGERHLFLRAPHPLTALRLRTPRLELRIPTVAELRELAEVARRGVHPPEEMPFVVAWTDGANEPGFIEDFVSYHRSTLADWRPEAWHLELVVFLDGRPVGAQGLTGEGFGSTREAKSGSWLGQEWQGRGLGTEMRTAILELAFRCLGAASVSTAAAEGNHASLGVTRKLGYQRVGESVATPRGAPIVHAEFGLERVNWRPPVAVEIEGCEAVRALFTG